MSNLCVMYDSRMNKVYFEGFSKKELNIFMAICAEVKEHGDELVIINVAKFKEEAAFTSGGSSVDFYTVIKTLSQKLAKIHVQFERLKDGLRRTEIGNVFSTLTYDEADYENLYVRVNPDYTWVFNEFDCYTSFDLECFTRLHGKYSKNLYRLLRQYKKGEMYVVEVEKLRKLLDIPETVPIKKYKPILLDAMEEIVSIDKEFANFMYDPMKSNHHGNPITNIRILWGKKAEKHRKQKGICNKEESFSKCESDDRKDFMTLLPEE